RSREEPIDQQTELVGRALAHGLQPPALDERRTIEDAEHDVGVAYVNSEEHKSKGWCPRRATSITTRSLRRKRSAPYDRPRGRAKIRSRLCRRSRRFPRRPASSR